HHPAHVARLLQFSKPRLLLVGHLRLQLLLGAAHPLPYRRVGASTVPTGTLHSLAVGAHALIHAPPAHSAAGHVRGAAARVVLGILRHLLLLLREFLRAESLDGAGVSQRRSEEDLLARLQAALDDDHAVVVLPDLDLALLRAAVARLDDEGGR